MSYRCGICGEMTYTARGMQSTYWARPTGPRNTGSGLTGTGWPG